MYLHLLRGYILAEFSINQTDVSSTYRVVERERENNASFKNIHNKKRDIISLPPFFPLFSVKFSSHDPFHHAYPLFPLQLLINNPGTN